MTLFADRLEAHGEHPAIVFADGQVAGYAGLAADADAVFQLAGAPRRPHTTVAIECANDRNTVLAYLGALRQRMPALLVDAGLPGNLRSRLYRRYRVGHVWTAAGAWTQTSDAESAPAHPDLALLLSTSGSTGEAKLVRLSRRNLQSNAEAIGEYLGLTRHERPITTLPPHYSYGLSVLNSHWAAGATVLLTAAPVTTAPFWDMCRHHRATSLAGVPTTYALLRKLRFERMLLPDLKTLTQAGGSLPLDDRRWIVDLARARSMRFFAMYGQTEASPRIAYLPPDTAEVQAGAIGVAIPGSTLAIVDETGAPVAQAGERGELVFTGPGVMMGYALHADDLSLPDLQGQTLRTGDLGWRDADGCFYVTGRIKRFIKVFGHRIGMDEVERQLRELGHVAAVTGHDDLLMVAVCNPTTDLDALAAWIGARYRLHPSGIKVVSIDTLPQSSSGKVQYQTLHDQLLAA